MKRNTVLLGCALLSGALVVTSAVLFAGRHGISTGANAFELTLTRDNGGLSNGSYSASVASGKAKTTQGNDFVFSYKNAKRYNTAGGQGFAIFNKGGEVISTEGVSGLLSIAATIDNGASLYVSFASSATSEFWSEAVEIGSDPIESPSGLNYFKVTSPDGTSYCRSITIRYNCGGTETGEDSSASSSEQAQPTPSGTGTITFSAAKGENQAIGDMAGSYSVNGLSVSGISVNKYVYGSSDGSLRFSSGSNSGNMVITLSEAAIVSYVKIEASAYNKDVPEVHISTSANATGESQTISSKGEYEYTSFASDAEESTTITISSAKSNRFYLYSVTLGLGEPTPVYPTSISLGKDLELGVGNSKTLSVSYTPSNTNIKEVSFSSSNTSVATVDANGKVTAKAEGTATITATAKAENGTVSDTVDVTVTEAPAVEKTAMKYRYSDYTENNVYTLDSAPTVGTTKLLVVPIWFTDSTNFISSSKKETVRSDIEKAYFGTTAETGWHSVKSFYETESMGALSFEGTVTSWYSVSDSYQAYASDDSGFDATIGLVDEVVSWYFSNNPSESRKDYDRDGDGYLDGVMLIYAAPNYASLKKETSSYTNLWAYCYWLQEEKNNSKNNPGPNTFFWASYDFMYDSSTASTRTGKSNYGYGDNSHCAVDAHTYIHEMGHVFGLDDYYDYGDNQYSHAGGFSMQDYNVGGHDPFSVMAYGWADPYIPTESCQITISTFQKNHDLILLTPSWNSFDSPWDEYLLLELYSPTGLNELDATYSYDGIEKGASKTGIRLWHVDARLSPCNSLDKDGYPVYSTALTSDLSAGKYGVSQAFTNTVGDEDYGSALGSTYDKYNLLKLIRNNTSAPLHAPASDFFQNSHLFGDGSTFSLSAYSSQFANKTKLNGGSALGWTFSVAITGSGHDATATITLDRQ